MIWDKSLLTNSACLSIIVAVLVAMIAIGIQKPDMASILAVRPDVPLLKGLGPVLNIILAYSTHPSLNFQLSPSLSPRSDIKQPATSPTSPSTPNSKTLTTSQKPSSSNNPSPSPST